MPLTKVETRGDITISRYEDGSFANAYEEVRTQVMDDDQPVGAASMTKRAIKDQATLAAMLGEAAASQRAHVDMVNQKIHEERKAHEAEQADMNARLQKAEKIAAHATLVVEAVRAADAEWNAKMAPVINARMPAPKSAEKPEPDPLLAEQG